jgi:uncharacterized protein YxeA
VGCLFRFFITFKIILFLVVISSCSQNENKHNLQNENPYIQLSTDQQKQEQKDETQSSETLDGEKNHLFSEAQSNQQQIEKQTSVDQKRDSLELTLEGFASEQEQSNLYMMNSEDQKTNYITGLKFNDFKERWNSISKDEMSDLLIRELDIYSENNVTMYQALLNQKIKLRVSVKNDFVQEIELIAIPESIDEKYKMLTGWNHIINIIHPNTEIYDVDYFFNKLGVGPNADLTNLKNQTLDYYGIQYTINYRESGYHFLVSYTNY